MGLDQYAYQSRHSLEELQTPDNGAEFQENDQIQYWRKHNRLEGWMATLWKQKTDINGPFNCELVQIELEDLEELEQVINSRTLPKTGGFFFGDDSYNDYEKYGDKDKDTEFIEKAREALNKGLNVYYTSWW